MEQQSPPPNPAEAYEQVIARNIFVPWAADLLERAAPQLGSRVLDLACGTGIVARQVASQIGPAGKLTGLDISPDMLAVAKRLTPEDGPPVEWREGSGTDMPFEDGSFDLVLCQQGLQFFPDHQAGLKEIGRVLATGGQAVISVWSDPESMPMIRAVDTVVSRHLGPGAFEVAYSLSDPGHLRDLALGAGLRDVDVQRVRLSISILDPGSFVPMMLQGAAAVLPQFAALEPEERVAQIGRMKEELMEAVQPLIVDEMLTYDSAANVLTCAR